MAYSNEEQKAILAYCKKHEAKLQLSSRPTVYFLLPDGTTKKENILNLVSQFKVDSKADAKEKARSQRNAEAQAERDGYKARYIKD